MLLPSAARESGTYLMLMGTHMGVLLPPQAISKAHAAHTCLQSHLRLLLHQLQQLGLQLGTLLGGSGTARSRLGF
jgi:hypothetical protein